MLLFVGRRGELWRYASEVASEGHWRVAALLIDAAADVNVENDYLRTPLAHAAEGGPPPPEV